MGKLDGQGASAAFNLPMGIAVDASGTLWVADTFNGAVRRIAPGGMVTTLACTFGNVGSVGNLTLIQAGAAPKGIALDSRGNIYVTTLWTSNSTFYQITPQGNISQVPVFGNIDSGLSGLAIGNGNFYLCNAWGLWTVSQ